MPIYRKTKHVKLKTEKFDLDGDSYVYLRELTAAKLNEMQQEHAGKETSNVHFIGNLLAYACTDEDGQVIFDNAEEVTHSGLGLSVMQKMSDTVLKLSGLETPKN